jgi:hypothetical protein
MDEPTILRLFPEIKKWKLQSQDIPKD